MGAVSEERVEVGQSAAEERKAREVRAEEAEEKTFCSYGVEPARGASTGGLRSLVDYLHASGV